MLPDMGSISTRFSQLIRRNPSTRLYKFVLFAGRYRPLFRASGEGHIRPFRSKIVQYFPSLSLVFILSNYAVFVQFFQGLEALLRGFTF